jgi:hypothetical protein
VHKHTYIHCVPYGSTSQKKETRQLFFSTGTRVSTLYTELFAQATQRMV